MQRRFPFKRRASLSADGKTYDGTSEVQNFDMLGNHIVGQDVNGTIHGTRLTVL